MWEKGAVVVVDDAKINNCQYYVWIPLMHTMFTLKDIYELVVYLSWKRVNIALHYSK